MRAPAAGNTVETLRPTDVNAAVAAMYEENAVWAAANPAAAAESGIVVTTSEIESVVAMHAENALWALENPAAAIESGIVFAPSALEIAEFDALVADASTAFEGTEYVTRAEFEALEARIELFNARSGHRI